MTFFKTKSNPDDFKATFQPGDLVRLKSGGPVMTVSMDRDGPGWAEVASHTGQAVGIYCSWFAGGVLHEGIFRAAQLEPAGPLPDLEDAIATTLREHGDEVSGMMRDTNAVLRRLKQPSGHDGN